MIGKIIFETPKDIWIDEFIVLRSKAYSFICDDKSKNKSKGISESQSKNIQVEVNKKCLDGEKYKVNLIIIS